MRGSIVGDHLGAAIVALAELLRESEQSIDPVVVMKSQQAAKQLEIVAVLSDTTRQGAWGLLYRIALEYSPHADLERPNEFDETKEGAK